MRSAVLANAQSRVAFRLPSEDARIIAAGSTLDPEDFQGLGAYECYAQLVAERGRAALVQRAHPATEQADQRSRRGTGSFPVRPTAPPRMEVEADIAGAGCSEAPESH